MVRRVCEKEGVSFGENDEIKSIVTRMMAAGLSIQMERTLTGGAGRKIKKFIGALLDEELIYCVGTDAHDKKHRPPKMKKAAVYVEKKCGEEYMRQIFYENAKEMVKRRGNRHHMEKNIRNRYDYWYT